jgi:large subunit ribosomal protein L19e
MGMATVRRIASEILGVGESKVRFKPEAASKIAEALTREDVRSLIAERAVYAISPRGVSRVRARKKKSQLRKGRRFGTGSRKGTYGARTRKKESWIAKVRAQRRYLSELASSGKLQEGVSRKLYVMVKGNAFKGVKMLENYLKENKLMKG